MERVPEREAGKIVRDNRTLVASYASLRRMRKLHMEVSTNGGLVGIKDFLGTTRANGEPSIRFEDRITRCNELANFALLFGDAPDHCRLIHGSMHGPFDGNERMRHAWLLLRTEHAELAWEPTTSLWHIKEEWYAYARVWEEREYVKRQAQTLMNRTGHYGPWHESRYP